MFAIYPLRMSRASWRIPLRAYHFCNDNCPVINHNHIVDCPYKNKIEPTFIMFRNYDINQEVDYDRDIITEIGILHQPDEIVIKDREIKIVIDFPLTSLCEKKVKSRSVDGFTRKQLIYEIIKCYQEVYIEEEKTATSQIHEITKSCECRNKKSSQYLSRLFYTSNIPSCSICTRNYHSRLHAYKTSCSHIFHKSCIEKWAETDKKKSCPICRSPLIVCSDCKNTGLKTSYITSVVVPREYRNGYLRNPTNGIHGIHMVDYENLILHDIKYNKINNVVNLKMNWIALN